MQTSVEDPDFNDPTKFKWIGSGEIHKKQIRIYIDKRLQPNLTLNLFTPCLSIYL